MAYFSYMLFWNLLAVYQIRLCKLVWYCSFQVVGNSFCWRRMILQNQCRHHVFLSDIIEENRTLPNLVMIHSVRVMLSCILCVPAT